MMPPRTCLHSRMTYGETRATCDSCGSTWWLPPDRKPDGSPATGWRFVGRDGWRRT